MNDTVIIFCAFSCMCRAQLWAESLGMQYSTVRWNVVCSQHFSESDFTSPECIRLNRMVVPTFCATTLHTHSTTLTFCTPPVSSSSPLLACPDYLPVQKTIKTYSKLSIWTSSKIFSSTEPSIAKHLLNNSNCVICRKCLISEVPSPLDVYTGFKEHTAVQYSLLHTQLRSWWRLLILL